MCELSNYKHWRQSLPHAICASLRAGTSFEVTSVLPTMASSSGPRSRVFAGPTFCLFSRATFRSKLPPLPVQCHGPVLATETRPTSAGKPRVPRTVQSRRRNFFQADARLSQTGCWMIQVDNRIILASGGASFFSLLNDAAAANVVQYLPHLSPWRFWDEPWLCDRSPADHVATHLVRHCHD